STITTEDGTVYYYKEVKSTSASETGDVVEGTTVIQYVYEKAGSVNVNYVDTDGNVIQTKVADETNAQAGTSYDTADNKPSTITTADGKTYKLVPAGTYNVGLVGYNNNLTEAGNGTATGVDSVTGTVEAGTTKEITYVYEEVKGDVVVNYITEDGTVIKNPVKDETDAPAGKSYDTTDNKPNTITTEDGTTYELVRVDGSETGTVVGGKTTEVTYVYRKVTPAKKVVTNHVDENGNPIAPQEEGTTPNKSIPGYEFTGKTVTDPDGNTTHIYRKVVTPVDPTDPVTPEDPTDPVTPVDPKAPVQPGVPVKPETPAKPTYVAETLPNTGEDNSASVAAMGAGMILASLGLAAKRRRKED
ncbi:MucBP domain-containing protein, partial [Streptococcus hyointestinalis]